MHDEALKTKAISMRSKGASLSTIVQKLGIAKSTASLWTRDVAEPVQRTSAERAATVRRAAAVRAARYVREARIAFVMLRKKPLFILGLGLYWGEGAKTGRSLSLVNSDPALLRVWIKWLKTYCHDVNLLFHVQVHHDDDPAAARAYWRNKLEVPKSQGITLSISPLKTKKRQRILRHGTCRVAAGKGGARMKYKMIEWLRLLAK